MAFFAKRPTMVAEEKDEGVIFEGTSVKSIEEQAYIVVGQGAGSEIGVDGVGPFFIANNILVDFVAGFVEVGVVARWRQELGGVDFVPKLLGRIPRHVGAEESAGDEERFILFVAGNEVGDLSCKSVVVGVTGGHGVWIAAPSVVTFGRALESFISSTIGACALAVKLVPIVWIHLRVVRFHTTGVPKFATPIGVVAVLAEVSVHGNNVLESWYITNEGSGIVGNATG